MPTPPPPHAAAGVGFLRSVLVLVSGTALAHSITALSMPLLSRLYSPAEFGLLAVFSSLLAIVAVAACLRYELAIALPESNDDALHLLALSMLCCIGLSLLLGALVLVVPDWLLGLLGQPKLRAYLWLAPLGLLLAGAYSALQFWHVRSKQFTTLAQTRIAQSAGSAATQIGLGWAGVSPLGLLLGHVMNTGIACFALGGTLCRGLPQLSASRLRALAFEYRRFPLYSSFEALANSAAMQLAIIMIAAQAAPAEAGYLMLAMYVAQAPMSLIGSAVSQVYLSRAPDEHRIGRLGDFTAETLSGLMRAGLGPLIAAGILSPVLFGAVFGQGWERAGMLVSWMVPWFLLQFLAVPVAMALHVTGHQKAAMCLQIGGLILRVGIVWAAGHFLPTLMTEAYALSGALFYLVYLLMIAAVTRLSLTRLLKAALASLHVTGGWLATALLIAAVVRTSLGGPLA